MRIRTSRLRVVILIFMVTLSSELPSSSASALPLAITAQRERFEPPLELLRPDLLLSDQQSDQASSATATTGRPTRFEAIGARPRPLAGRVEFDARRFAPALLSRRELLDARGLHDAPIDMVDLVRLRWSSAHPADQLVRARLSFDRGASTLRSYFL